MYTVYHCIYGIRYVYCISAYQYMYTENDVYWLLMCITMYTDVYMYTDLYMYTDVYHYVYTDVYMYTVCIYTLMCICILMCMHTDV